MKWMCRVFLGYLKAPRNNSGCDGIGERQVIVSKRTVSGVSEYHIYCPNATATTTPGHIFQIFFPFLRTLSLALPFSRTFFSAFLQQFRDSESRKYITSVVCFFSYYNRANINLFIMRGLRHLPIQSQKTIMSKNQPKTTSKYMPPNTKISSNDSFSPCVSYSISRYDSVLFLSTYTNRFFNEPATVIFRDHSKVNAHFRVILFETTVSVK